MLSADQEKNLFRFGARRVLPLVGCGLVDPVTRRRNSHGLRRDELPRRGMREEHQMKLGFSLCASLISLGVIPSSVSLAQSGWFWQNPLPQGNRLSAVSALDSTTATGVGELGTILRTTDGAPLGRCSRAGRRLLSGA